jgi:hypothetical protein
MRFGTTSTIGLALLLGFACSSRTDLDDGGDAGETEGISASAGTDTVSGDGDGDGDADASAGETDTSSQDTDDPTSDPTGDPTDPGPCQVATCQGHTYQCGDCIDNDGDGLIDAADPGCWGPCDNNEAGWKGEVPGQQNQSTCLVMDCYFDQDSGAGNDDCYWSHSCDELEPMGCNHNSNANVPGANASCGELFDEQSDLCLDFCGALTPNGCDCFGCCAVHLGDGEIHTVYIGTENNGQGTCNVESAADPDLCNPCTQVPGCLKGCNPDECEICIGQTEIPEDCDEAKCPDGIQSCNPQNGHADCQDGQSCITGCCYNPPG